MQDPMPSQTAILENPLFDEVLKSGANKKVVVAGPGTGKTLLFKELLLAKPCNTLTLTFINSLVDDLSLELCGLTDSKTLHSFARSILHKVNGAGGIPVSNHLTKIIGEDLKVTSDKDVDFEKVFHLMEDSNPEIPFYKKRQSYYGHYGYADLIYDAVKHLDDEKNADDIPNFDQIFIDEFQDFNDLEVGLIDILAKKNSVLIVGDDDQALYDVRTPATNISGIDTVGRCPATNPSRWTSADEIPKSLLTHSTT